MVRFDLLIFECIMIKIIHNRLKILAKYIFDFLRKSNYKTEFCRPVCNSGFNLQDECCGSVVDCYK